MLFVIAALASFFALAGTAPAEYEYAGTFASEGSGDGQFAASPGRAALESSTGNLFVVDRGNDRVQVFKPSGVGGAEYLTQFGAGQLADPYGIAIDEEGGQTRIYVADAGNNRIVRYDSDESASPSLTLDGSFSLAAGKVEDYKAALAVDPTTHDLLLADPGSNQVQRFGADGSFKAAFDGSAGTGSPGAFAALRDIATSAGGDIYVVARVGDEFVNTRALRYNSSGAYKAELTPVGPNQRPGTVAVDRISGRVAVSGNQDAVEFFQTPTLHLFSSSNAPLESPVVDFQFGTFHGLAFGTRIYAVLDVGENPFGFPPAPRVDVFADFHKPSLVMDPVEKTSTTATSAKLTGTVNPNGLASEWHFEYSADGGGSWTSTPMQSAGSSTTPVAVSAEATGLEQEVPYLVRLVGSNSDGQRISASRSFTLTYVREVTTTGIGNHTPTSLILTGTVNPGGLELTECKFEYGLTTNYGSVAPCAQTPAEIGSGEARVPVYADVSDLDPGDYHFRFVAANADGSTQGEDDTFSMVALPDVSDFTGSVFYPEATHTEARLNAKIDPGNGKTTYRVEYGPTTSYGRSTLTRALPKSIGPRRVFAFAAPLDGGVTYHFRVVATNESGTTNSDDLTLTTGPARPADGCANAALRAAQDSRGLGDCRAYEMVSPVDKEGNGVDMLRTVQAAPSGEAAAFSATGTFSGGESSVSGNYYIGRRSQAGWTTEAIDAPQYNQSSAPLVRPSLVLSPDLSGTIQMGSRAVAPGAVEGGGNIYLRNNLDGSRKLLASVSPGSDLIGYYNNATVRPPLGAADDLSNFVFSGPEPFLPGVAPGVDQVYEVGPNHLQVASRLPDGSIPAEGAALGGFQERPFQPISADGRRVLFAYPPDRDTGALYMRVDGEQTIPLSVSHRAGDSDEPQPAQLQGMSKDGTVVYFTSKSELTDGIATALIAPALYRLDVLTDELTLVTKPIGPYTPFLGDEVVATSDDGETVIFASSVKLTSEYVEFEPALYIAKDGEITRLGGLPNEFVGPESSAISPNGRYVAFDSIDRFTGYDNAGPHCVNGEGGVCREVFLYDTVKDELVCVTCTGDPDRDRSSYFGGKVGAISEYRPRAVLDDGKVFFSTAMELDPRDTNDRQDVYQWQDGSYSLISSGRSTSDSYFSEASPNGSDVFFITAERLVASDTDDEFDLYDARANGGLAAQNQPVISIGGCEGEACRGPASAPSSLPAIGSGSFESGAGRPRKTEPAFRVSAPKAVTGPVATLKVKTPGKGRISARGKGVKATHKVAAKAATYRLKVQLTSQGVRKLKRQGVVRVSLRVTYDPGGGALSSSTATLVFKAVSNRKGN
ncbi:MAG TPA: NHL repeat-containing protein [Solirubrobacterales bacterium]|nr:NHL repeat-containing protein [Solirubrobacterales bacterium]